MAQSPCAEVGSPAADFLFGVALQFVAERAAPMLAPGTQGRRNGQAELPRSSADRILGALHPTGNACRRLAPFDKLAKQQVVGFFPCATIIRTDAPRLRAPAAARLPNCPWSFLPLLPEAPASGVLGRTRRAVRFLSRQMVSKVDICFAKAGMCCGFGRPLHE